MPLTKLNSLAADFHAAHRHRFGYADEGQPIEVVTLRTLVTTTDAVDGTDESHQPGHLSDDKCTDAVSSCTDNADKNRIR